MHKNKYILALLALSAAMPAALYALDSSRAALSVHGAITRDALNSTLAPANLKAVIDANDSQDAPGEGQSEKRRHFEGNVFPAAVAYINREKNRALTLSAEADTDEQSRADALRHFGLMLHAVQDFYLHTNYIELELEDQHNKSDPYNLPLVDWNRVPDGYGGSKSGKQLAACMAVDGNDPIDKSAATTPGGRVVVAGGATQFTVAQELAVKETERQWKLFETLVRTRCAGRAPAVLAALRHADPTAQTQHEDQTKESQSY
ncbi:MAG TPA: HET-C-related protein [Candidatus Obscuribacterales bacterium]